MTHLIELFSNPVILLILGILSLICLMIEQITRSNNKFVATKNFTDQSNRMIVNLLSDKRKKEILDGNVKFGFKIPFDYYKYLMTKDFNTEQELKEELEMYYRETCQID